jgi:RHS repeat-associated protein
MKNSNTIFFLFCLAWLPFTTSAQTINGSTTVTVGSAVTYTYNDGIVYTSGTFQILTGSGSISTSRSGSTYSGAAQFTAGGTVVIAFMANGASKATLSITVNCSSVPTPVATFSYSNNCSGTTITYSGTPPTGVSWYWQTTSTGTTTANFGSSFTATTNGTYYLRAKCNTTWSTASLATSNVTVPILPGVPPSTTGASVCPNNIATLSASIGANGDGIRWYSAFSGGTLLGTGTSFPTPTLSATNTYYACTYRNSPACESSRLAVVATVFTPPATPATPLISSNTCGPKILSYNGTPPAGVGWFWQGTNPNPLSADYTSPTATASTFTAATNTVTSTSIAYYIAARNSTTGCWNSSAASVSPVVDIPPTPVPNVNSFLYCEFDALVMAFGSGTYANLRWYDATNTIIYTGGSYTPSNVDNGIYSYTIKNYSPNNCESSSGAAISLQVGGPLANCDQYLNWEENISYSYQNAVDFTGSVVADSKVYSDGFGKTIQSQVKSLATSQVFASESIYDKLGNQTLSTLPAPINSSTFGYRYRFTTNSGGSKYSWNDFDQPVNTGAVGELNNPSTVNASTPGTLGWYYSAVNNLETNTPVSSYPFSRSFIPPGPNPLTSKSAGPGDAYRMGAGHESQSDKSKFTSSDLSHYFSLRSYFVVAPNLPTPTGTIGYRIVSTDPDKKQTATFIDADGRTLASALVTSTYGAQTLTFDNWSYNYYNDLSQLVATVAPNGVIVGNTAMPNFVTTYKYDNLGRLIETNSPDEGISQFVYSTDGKIRFSQNAEQRNASPKRFSYTNYDYLGRLLESGEYTSNGTGPFNFDPTDVATPSANSVLAIIDSNIPQGYDIETFTSANFTGPSYKLDNVRCSDYTFIKYDIQASDFTADANHAAQNNLIGHVSKTQNANATTWYSYDEFGQVEWTKQSISTAFKLSEPLTWSSLTNITQTGNLLNKSGGTNTTWDAGAFSVQFIPAGTDGYLEFMTGETTTNKMIGLSATDGGVSYTGINFAIYVSTGASLKVYENGALKGTFGTYAATDVFRIERQGTTIYYKQNGNIIYTSTVASSSPLYGDCSMYSLASTLKNISLGITNGFQNLRFQMQPAIQLTNITGVVQTGSTLTKAGVADAAWNAGAFSVQSIPAGSDGYLEFGSGETTLVKAIGLSSTDANVNYTSINFAVYFDVGAALKIYENGTQKATSTYTTTDVFRIERKGTTIYYRKNGALLYTSATSSSTALYADASFYNLNAVITNVSIGLPFGAKTIDYTYDFLGNVTRVAYQKGQIDAFYYHYTYNQDGKLTDAATSFDGVNITPQAKYKYYLHGPLKRVELATNLQGIDYVYTINGALKGINHADVAKDPGNDATGTNGFSTDVFGETLNYFANDYIGAGYNAGTFNVTGTGVTDYYGGQIKSASWFTPIDNSNTNKKIYGYSYDQLNRFTNAQWGTVTGSAGSYSAALSPVNYNESISSYDNNGNIKGLNRNDKSGSALGSYNYNYTLNTNKLASITGSTTVNYTYNNIGQMTQQTEGGKTMKVSYNAYGLTKEVRDGNNNLTEQYNYDDRGDLVQKLYYNSNSLVPFKIAYYVRDVSGNVLATYEQNNSAPIALIELPIYGSGRLGMVKMKGGQPKYFYEVNDHLGNVRTVIGSPYTDNFLATMEPANAAKETKQFVDITSTAITYGSANHTPDFTIPPSTQVITSSYVSRLNAQQNGTTAPHIVGPGIIVPVSPGDRISASVYGYFETGTYSNTNLLPATMAAALAAALGGVTPGDPTVLQNSMTKTYNSDPLFAGELSNPSTNVPHAYLNMVVFDGYLNYVTSNQSMSQAVGFPSNATAGTKIPLSFSNIPITSPGWAYIWVDVNGADNNYVYFDDLSISQLHSPYVAGGDFYPFGLTMDDRQIKSERYRYGYQGQYSEYDSLTKTNNFQLRLYDPRFGRWLSPDPYRIGNSPYIGMGNNPVGLTDPDGGCPWCAIELALENFQLTLDFLEDFGQIATTLDEVTVSAISTEVTLGDRFYAAINQIGAGLGQINRALDNTGYFADAVNNSLTYGLWPTKTPHNEIQQQMHDAGRAFAMGLSLYTMRGGGYSGYQPVPVPVSPVRVIPTTTVVPVVSATNLYGQVFAGTQLNSKTIWKGRGKERLDVENPNPSQRPGQIHYQDNAGNKYIYDPATNTFRNAPKQVNDLLNDPRFMAAIKKGLSYLGIE